MKKILTTKEAAEYLRINQKTLLRYIRTGKVRGVKLVGRYRILEEDLVRFVERAKSPTELNKKKKT